MMLNDKTWVNIFGASRGSTFVFNYLKQHPQISSTTIKEPLNRCDIVGLNCDTYKTFIDYNSLAKSKIILDGTPAFVGDNKFYESKKFLKLMGIDNALFLYFFRDPYKILRSKILLCLLNNQLEGIDEILSGSFNFESVKMLKRIETVFSRQNIYICCIEDFLNDISCVFDFLEIDNLKLNEAVYSHNAGSLFRLKADLRIKYIKYTQGITPSNKRFSWIYNDYKDVDDKYGTNLVEFYKLCE